MDQAIAQMSPLEQQLADLARRHPGTVNQPFSGALGLVTVPQWRVPAGWNQVRTNIHFVVPAGYPFANPDCFFADATLRLADQRLPQNSNVQALQGVGEVLWFSWHLNGAWRANKDNLCTWLAVIANRFEQRQ